MLYLQELELQGIKIRDGVVFSQYSLVKSFAYDLSIFLAIVLVAVFQSLLYYDTIGFEGAVWHSLIWYSS